MGLYYIDSQLIGAMTKDILWASENAAALNRLRIEKGLDAFQLARMVNLSSHQISELESQEPLTKRSHFYSPEIKAQLGHRVLVLLQT
jgi:DNA-binding XRE family transcriptional regulator